MIYIVTSLKNAAHAFVDSHKFHKTQAGDFSLFSNDTMHLIFSDSGVHNARLATQALINLYDITDEDIYIYIGVCEDCSTDEVGSLLQVDSSIYTSPEDDSFGFYDAVIHSPAIKNFSVFEIPLTQETLNQVQHPKGISCGAGDENGHFVILDLIFRHFGDASDTRDPESSSAPQGHFLRGR